MVDPLSFSVPESIETPRLILRAFRVSDAPQLHEALTESIGELRTHLWFLPWVAEEQSLQSAEVGAAGRRRTSCSEQTCPTSPSTGNPVAWSARPGFIERTGRFQRLRLATGYARVKWAVALLRRR